VRLLPGWPVGQSWLRLPVVVAAGPVGQPGCCRVGPVPGQASAGSPRDISTAIRTLRPVKESDNGPPDRRRLFSLRTARMEAFSDGIFAIASTLLVLDLAVPPTTSDVPQKLRQQWPMYLAYVVSFTSIGQAWLNHSVITEYLDRGRLHPAAPQPRPAVLRLAAAVSHPHGRGVPQQH
jgi:Endosomal/lysosomal potassium channel TMEM175